MQQDSVESLENNKKRNCPSLSSADTEMIKLYKNCTADSLIERCFQSNRLDHDPDNDGTCTTLGTDSVLMSC